jgi:hypothetical protein
MNNMRINQSSKFKSMMREHQQYRNIVRHLFTNGWFPRCTDIWLDRVFGSVVVGAFQIAFRAEIHANDVFSFLKNHFWHQHIKTIQKVQTALNFSKKKKFQNLMKRSYERCQSTSLLMQTAYFVFFAFSY